MERKYYLCNNLDELELAQNELVKSGFKDQQLHVLSDDDAAVVQHHLHEVNCFSKTDIVNSTVRGALIGIGLSALALLLPYLFGMTQDIGWTPFILMAIIALGFSTWEGGLWGIQEMNANFKNFEYDLHRGMHVLIVDCTTQQRLALQKVVQQHPAMKPA
jgi:hypothetical protein